MENTTSIWDRTEEGKCAQDNLHRNPYQFVSDSHLTDSASIKSGVQQGFIRSPFRFILAID